MKINLKILVVILIFAGLVNAGCGGMTKSQKGVIIGAGVGGAVGAGIGKAAGNTVLGAIIGGTVGGVAGGVIGRKMDKQAEELEKIEGAEVKRVEEGINVTFSSGVLFATNESELSIAAQKKLVELADVLKKYPNTYVLIEGHTDNTGSSELNMKLSEARAKSVESFLKIQNIAPKRLKTAWYGETQPKYPNDTEANRLNNRRVEFAIYADEKMIEEAKKEAGN